MNHEVNKTFNFHRLDIVYANKISLYLYAFACALFFTYYYFNEELIILHISWLFAFLFYIAFRIASTMFYNYFKSSNKYSHQFFENICIAVSLYGGLLWGVSSFFFLRDAQANDLLVATTMYAGLCSGSIASNAASKKSSFVFTYSLILTAITSFASLDGEFKYSLIAVLAIFITAISTSINMIYQSMTKNIQLRLDKELLLENLESANNERLIIERQAILSTKMASIGEMASGMAHEINNPLTIIKGNLTLMKKRSTILNDNNEDELISKSFDRCLENIERIVKTIESLKKMSTMHSNDETCSIKVSTLIEDSIGFISEKLKCSNIQLIKDIDNSSTLISCNSINVSQTLLGLITNAYHITSYKTYSWIKIKSYNDEKFAYFEVSTSEEDKHIKDLTNALMNEKIELGDKSRIHNITLCQSTARSCGGDLFFKENDSKNTLVLKIPLNIHDDFNKAA